ncbi:MAG TPA: hypothetical protein VNA14_11965 [Mycobacteriales bacterium]|nr:hypothetical protein [Mycobacteriales bacterium]
MPRRSQGGVALLAAAFAVAGLAPLTPAHAAKPCFLFTDVKGDGEVNYVGEPETAMKDNDPDIDILGVSYGTTADKLVVKTTVAALGDRPAKAPGDSIMFAFTLNEKKFEITTERFVGPLTEVYDTVLATAVEGGKSYMYVNDVSQPVTVDATYDKATNTITLSVPKSTIETHAKVPVDGSTFSGFVTEARADYFLEFTYDVAKPAAETTWVGGVPCQQPAGKLAYAGATSAQYGDTAALKTTLTDTDGVSLASKPVQFKLGAVTVPATTGADGVATATLPAGTLAGTHSLVTSFAGDDDAGKVSQTTSFVVKPETTKTTLTIARSGTKRTATAKVVDDDGKPVVGQPVVWLVNGAKVKTANTSTTGAVTLSTAKSGQTVTALFNAVPGKYATSKATAKA